MGASVNENCQLAVNKVRYSEMLGGAISWLPDLRRLQLVSFGAGVVRGIEPRWERTVTMPICTYVRTALTCFIIQVTNEIFYFFFEFKEYNRPFESFSQ